MLANGPRSEHAPWFDFAADLLERPPDDFRAFQRRLAFYGAVNGLTQLLVKLAAPGVADFYQGTELWDLSLVDPDNRRVVDYETRKRMLEELSREEAGDRPRLLAARDLFARFPLALLAGA
ncbi:MAG TPA: hypothetical protein VF121_18860 [Thermoanaerobaculia bacterium]|nr:hypothetical protein [Thermoanaerobaculia bacterium]